MDVYLKDFNPETNEGKELLDKHINFFINEIINSIESLDELDILMEWINKWVNLNSLFKKYKHIYYENEWGFNIDAYLHAQKYNRFRINFSALSRYQDIFNESFLSTLENKVISINWKKYKAF